MENINATKKKEELKLVADVLAQMFAAKVQEVGQYNGIRT